MRQICLSTKRRVHIPEAKNPKKMLLTPWFDSSSFPTIDRDTEKQISCLLACTKLEAFAWLARHDHYFSIILESPIMRPVINFDALVRRCSAYLDHVRRPERTLNRRKLNGGRQVFFTDDRARPPLDSTNRRGSSKIKLSRISKFEHRLVAETKLPRLARADLKFAAPRYIDMLEVLTLGNFGSVLTRTRLSLSRSAKFTPTSFFSLL